MNLERFLDTSLTNKKITVFYKKMKNEIKYTILASQQQIIEINFTKYV